MDANETGPDGYPQVTQPMAAPPTQAMLGENEYIRTADPDLAVKLRTLGVSAVVKPFVVGDLAKKLLELLDAIGLNERNSRPP